MNYTCTICNRDFTLKNMYDKHVIYCEALLIDMKNSQNEPTEKKYTDAQKDKLIRLLLVQNHTMKKQLTSLTNKMKGIERRKRVNMGVWLNKNVKPLISWKQYIKELCVQESDFQTALENSLANGVQECLQNNLLNQNEIILPIYAFRQKDKTLYVYEENTWSRIEKEAFIKSIHNIVYKIQQHYFTWRNAKMGLLESSDEWKNRDMEYSQRMMGMDSSHHASMGKIYGVLYEMLKKDFEEIQVCDDDNQSNASTLTE